MSHPGTVLGRAGEPHTGAVSRATSCLGVHHAGRLPTDLRPINQIRVPIAGSRRSGGIQGPRLCPGSGPVPAQVSVDRRQAAPAGPQESPVQRVQVHAARARRAPDRAGRWRLDIGNEDLSRAQSVLAFSVSDTGIGACENSDQRIHLEEQPPAVRVRAVLQSAVSAGVRSVQESVT